MHTSISKRLLAAALSVMMVLSLVAPSMSTQAASKYSLTKKVGTTATAGKVNTYYVKGVKKTQYIKVTGKASGVVVKKGTKTLKTTTKVNGTGKTITLKVTAPDKVANYTNKLTVKVYNKKTNKLVKTLAKSTKVKVSELKVTGVETASKSAKYLVATFNKKLDTLKVADITIRAKETGIMLGVESVQLASDGKSATIALVGDENANDFIEKNIEYTFAVSQKGVTASTVFMVNEVLDNVEVLDYSAKKQTITVDYAGELNVPASLDVDFEELLGRSVTVWYNNENTITKLVVIKNKVVYGAFKTTVKDGTAYLTDLATGDQYFTQDSTVSEMIPRTRRIVKAATTTCGFYTKDITGINNDVVAYGKLTLNSNGTIKTIVAVPNWNNVVLVSGVKDNFIVTAGITSFNMKDYTFVKDGKTIAITDVKAGDVVSYNNAAKFAEVYSNVVTGKLDAVYKGQFKFNGKVIDYNNATTYNFPAQYIYDGYGVYDIDETYMSSLLAGKEDITVYFDRKGNPAFVSGKTAEVTTANTQLVLTKAAHVYTEPATGTRYIRFVGVSTKDEKSYTFDVNISELKKVTVGTNKYVVGALCKDLTDHSSHSAAGDKVTGFTNTTNSSKEELNYVCPQEPKTTIITDLATTFAIGETVTLTANKDNGNVTQIATDGVDGVKDLTSGGDAYNFIKGYKTLTCASGSNYVLQITNDTPLYIVDKDVTPAKVTKTTYGSFAGTVLTADLANVKVHYDAKDHRDVAYVVVDNDDIKNSTKTTTIKAIVSNCRFDAVTGNMVELEVAYGNEIKTFTKFSADIAKESTPATQKTGAIVDITLEQDAETVQAIVASGSLTTNAEIDVKGISNDGWFDVTGGSGTGFEFATSTTATIALIENGVLKVIDFNDLTRLDEVNEVNFSNFTSYYVDALVVISKDSRPTDAANIAADKAAVSATDATSTTAADAKAAILSAATNNTVKSVVVTAKGAKATDANEITLTVTFDDNTTKEVVCSKILDTDYVALTVGQVL